MRWKRQAGLGGRSTRATLGRLDPANGAGGAVPGRPANHRPPSYSHPPTPPRPSTLTQKNQPCRTTHRSPSSPASRPTDPSRQSPTPIARLLPRLLSVVPACGRRPKLTAGRARPCLPLPTALPGPPIADDSETPANAGSGGVGGAGSLGCGENEGGGANNDDDTNERNERDDGAFSGPNDYDSDGGAVSLEELHVAGDDIITATLRAVPWQPILFPDARQGNPQLETEHQVLVKRGYLLYQPYAASYPEELQSGSSGPVLAVVQTRVPGVVVEQRLRRLENGNDRCSCLDDGNLGDQTQSPEGSPTADDAVRPSRSRARDTDAQTSC